MGNIPCRCRGLNETGSTEASNFRTLLNFNPLRKRRAKQGRSRRLWGGFDEELHAAIAMAEPDLLGASREKKRLLLAQFAACVAR